MSFISLLLIHLATIHQVVLLPWRKILLPACLVVTLKSAVARVSSAGNSDTGKCNLPEISFTGAFLLFYLAVSFKFSPNPNA